MITEWYFSKPKANKERDGVGLDDEPQEKVGQIDSDSMTEKHEEDSVKIGQSTRSGRHVNPPNKYSPSEVAGKKDLPKK